MKRYSVRVNIGVSAIDEKEARAKIQAMLAPEVQHYYKGKFLLLNSIDLSKAEVTELPF